MSNDGFTRIEPTTATILADINRENMKWSTALGDLIDNSLDAGASRVVIDIDRKGKKTNVEIRDNGSGCDKPASMMQQGFSTKSGTKSMLGRYGVGLKHASYWLCGVDGATTIVTRSGGVARMASVRWGDIIKMGEWKIPAVQELTDEQLAVDLIDNRGTSIVFRNTDGRQIKSDTFKSLRQEFGFVFSPALRGGRQIEIVLNGARHQIAAPSDPVWSESDQFEVVIGNRKARVRAGIKAPGDTSGRLGMSYTFGHRVIIADESDGLGWHSRNGFAGFVDLNEHWDLGQNKTSITDKHWEDLCDQIHARIRPMLEKLKSASMVVQFEALKDDVSMMLGEVLGGHRWNIRGDRSRVGPFPGAGPSKKRGGQGEAGSGSEAKARAHNSMRVDFYEDPNDRRGGYVESNGHCVQLNTACHRVRQARESDDRDWLVQSAAVLLLQRRCDQNLPGQRSEPFQDMMGRLWSGASRVGSVMQATA